jgi:hypothetical protein
MEEVHKPSDSESYTRSSELLRFYRDLLFATCLMANTWLGCCSALSRHYTTFMPQKTESFKATTIRTSGHIYIYINLNPVVWVLERPPLVFADRGCHVVSVTNPYGHILDFPHRGRYFFCQVAPQLYSRGWVDPVLDPLLLRKSGSAGNRTRTSGSVAAAFFTASGSGISQQTAERKVNGQAACALNTGCVFRYYTYVYLCVCV